MSQIISSAKARMISYVKEATGIFKMLIGFIKQCLGNKRIVVISDQNISSLPISFKVQFIAVFLTLGSMVWFSYSTGKYFAYKDVLTEKDREIWLTNATNENLQYEVFDLHRNLSELNKYFGQIQSYEITNSDSLKERAISGPKGEVPLEYAAGEEQLIATNGVQGILDNIHEKMRDIRVRVIERIENLELVIKITGIDLEKVAQKNDNLKTLLKNRTIQKRSEGTGGAFIPAENTMDADSFDEKSFDNEVKYLAELEKEVKYFPLYRPLKRYRITSRFGKRVDPMRGSLAMHHGIDLVGPHRARVYSTAPGEVIFAGRRGAYGFFVEIKHSDAIVTRYGHLDRILVRSGQQVKRGDTIGLQGNTGRSTGSHLHYEVKINNQAVDPINFLEASNYVF